MGWFEVDKKGLAELWAGKSKSFIIRELVQNSWDEPGVTWCAVRLSPTSKKGIASLEVEDDAPDGFKDIAHAYTLYAHTEKRKNPESRGRFNLGEKQVLSLCTSARIITTTGSVIFDPDGNRRRGRISRSSGSIFKALVRMRKSDIEECFEEFKTFIPPKDILTTFNGVELESREPISQIKAPLFTEFEKDGIYRSTIRETMIEIYEPFSEETPILYEMGLPVVETGDKWHYNILQKVPLTSDRNNVRPAFLRDVRAEVVNSLASDLTEEDVAEPWVHEAASDDRISRSSLKEVANKRWGKSRVVPVPGDPKSKEKAIALGYTLVHPREMGSEEWGKMKEFDLIPSAKKVFPHLTTDFKEIPFNKWTGSMKRVARITSRVAELTLGIKVRVKMIDSPDADTEADYGDRCVRYNVSKLGEAWFESPLEKILELVIHELGHEGGSHIEQGYYNTLCKIGAALIKLLSSDLENDNES